MGGQAAPVVAEGSAIANRPTRAWMVVVVVAAAAGGWIVRWQGSS